MTDLPDNRKPRPMPPDTDWRTTKYRKLSALLDMEAGEWIDQMRAQTPSPSWQKVSRLLWTHAAIDISHESLRTWWELWRENGRQEQVT